MDNLIKEVINNPIQVILIISSVLQSLEIAGLFDLLSYKYKVVKPFSCPYCLSWWIPVMLLVYYIASGYTIGLNMVLPIGLTSLTYLILKAIYKRI